jgi:PD-(D/E)XK nuclease superfamily
MNIFKILSMGDGRIKEPSISSFLAYILNPDENDHDLKRDFLNRFFSIIKDENDTFSVENPEVSVEVQFEEHLKINEINRDYDILITFYKTENGERKLLKYICIENKIREPNKDDSRKQINDLISGFSQKLSPLDVFNYFVYLTPPDVVLPSQINRRGITIKRIFWSTSQNDNSVPSITEILKDSIILYGKSIYVDYLLKCFCEFIESGFSVELAEPANPIYTPTIVGEKEFNSHTEKFSLPATVETFRYLEEIIDKVLIDKNIQINKNYFQTNIKNSKLVYRRSENGGPKDPYYIRMEIGINNIVLRMPVLINKNDMVVPLSETNWHLVDEQKAQNIFLKKIITGENMDFDISVRDIFNRIVDDFVPVGNE